MHLGEQHEVAFLRGCDGARTEVEFHHSRDLKEGGKSGWEKVCLETPILVLAGYLICKGK